MPPSFRLRSYTSLPLFQTLRTPHTTNLYLLLRIMDYLRTVRSLPFLLACDANLRHVHLRTRATRSLPLQLRLRQRPTKLSRSRHCTAEDVSCTTRQCSTCGYLRGARYGVRTGMTDIPLFQVWRAQRFIHHPYIPVRLRAQLKKYHAPNVWIPRTPHLQHFPPIYSRGMRSASHSTTSLPPSVIG